MNLLLFENRRVQIFFYFFVLQRNAEACNEVFQSNGNKCADGISHPWKYCTPVYSVQEASS